MYSVALFMGFPTVLVSDAETGADKVYVARVAIEHPSLSGLSRPSSTIQQETTRHTASTDRISTEISGFHEKFQAKCTRFR